MNYSVFIPVLYEKDLVRIWGAERRFTASASFTNSLILNNQKINGLPMNRGICGLAIVKSKVLKVKLSKCIYFMITGKLKSNF